MHRYLKVRGQRGKLVANPYALGTNPRRYAGQKFVVKDPVPREHVDRYEPCEEVLVDEPSLRKAAKRGELDILSEGDGERADLVTWRERPQAAHVAPEQPAAPAEGEQAPADPEPDEEQPAPPEPEKENG